MNQLSNLADVGYFYCEKPIENTRVSIIITLKKRRIIMLYLTPDQICQMFQIKKDKLYKMTSQKRIPFLKVGNELRFDPAEVEKVFKVKDTVRRILV